MRSIYIKAPLVFGIAQTVAYLMVAYLSNGVMEISLKRMIGYFFVASIVGWVLAWLHVRSTSKEQRDGGKTSDVRQQRRLTVFLSYDQSFEACVDSLASIGARVTSQSKAQGTIEAKTGLSWKSFGEVITISLRRATDNLVEIEVNSRPAMSTTLFDHGRNWDNVKSVSDFLSQRSSKVFEAVKSEQVYEKSVAGYAQKLRAIE